MSMLTTAQLLCTTKLVFHAGSTVMAPTRKAKVGKKAHTDRSNTQGLITRQKATNWSTGWS